jgi:hypothetical protein
MTYSTRQPRDILTTGISENAKTEGTFTWLSSASDNYPVRFPDFIPA